jgi:sulfatase maturation enzyme AslB (radical SAM superfamily)
MDQVTMPKQKFSSPQWTAKGEARASVPFHSFETLWFNTGTLCNLECSNCYIESSPKNDRLSYLTTHDVLSYLDEIEQSNWKVACLGFTGGEPFLNPNIISILSECLKRGHQVLVLTNAFKVLKRWEDKLIDLNQTYPSQLRLRVSLDHFSPEIHEKERGKGTFVKTIQSIKWLYQEKFSVSLAGRSLSDENQEDAKKGYFELLKSYDIHLELGPDKLVIFPEMIPSEDVPEISVHCWDILGKRPEDQMCATERMIVKKKGNDTPQVQSCTLLAYQEEFNMGTSLRESQKSVPLNHVFCSKFCVLGGASCSSTS